MTHGEDAGPDTHQDSAVLTYLEGLLMHPVATAPGATATRRSDADRNGNEEQRRNHAAAAAAAAAAQGPSLANYGLALREKASPPGGGASQHLKKARLLRSGAWGAVGDERTKGQSSASLNGHLAGQQQQQQQRSGQDGSPLGESTLLASLLTTFSSRLQGVAMSQQPEQQNCGDKCASPPPGTPHDHSTSEAYGTASSRLKGLVRKSKSQSQSHDSRRASQDRLSESPCSNASAAAQLSPSDSAVSCAERLKAVANLVKTRSSPAPSPRPSMACSQLALLLSSEAHLKQYSREQVLKAQLAGQSASERLAAIASQKSSSQDPGPATVGETRMLSEAANATNGQSRTSPLASASATRGSPALSAPHNSSTRGSPALSAPHSSSTRGSPALSAPHNSSTRGSPALSAPHSSSSSSRVVSPHASPQPQRERRLLDKSGTRPPQSGTRPPQSCSSLLLLLLNNHNSQKQLTRNGHLEEEHEEEEEEEEDEEEERIPPCHGPSLLLDHWVRSDQYCSPTRSSSDVESCYSSCSPMDLSMHTRVPSHESAPPSASSSSLVPPSASSSSLVPPSASSSSLVPPSASSSSLVPPSASSYSLVPPSASSSSLVPPSASSYSLVPPSASSSSLVPPSASSSCPLDLLTETLLNRWKPDPPRPKVSETGELAVSPDTKSHHKVTLMQLLLDRQNNEKVNNEKVNNEKVNKIGDNSDLQRCDATLNNLRTDPLEVIGGTYEDSRRESPADCRIGVGHAMTRFSLNADSSGSPSPYSFSPHVQSGPLDLCKAKSSSSEKAPESGFSASKLLQNLAQCGLTNISPSPPPPPPPLLNRRTSKRPSPDLLPSQPSALLECLSPPPTQRNGSPAAEPVLHRSFTPHRRESPVSPAASQMEALLERRTVLQLLLGSAAHVDRASGRRGTEQPSVRSHVRSPDTRDSSLDIKIKTEPKEDGQFSSSSDNDHRPQHWSHERYERHRPLFEHQGDIKSEPCPDDIVSKYGLLSQLLKQQTNTYNSGTPSDYNSGTPSDYDSRALKQEQQEQQEQQEHHGGPSPKRRRLCMELAEQLSSELWAGGPVDSYEGRGGELLLSPKQEESAARSPINKLLLSPKQEESAARSPINKLLLIPQQEESAARSPVNKQLPRDHQGFNVLKQLLLSDNCLKGVPQRNSLKGVSQGNCLQGNGLKGVSQGNCLQGNGLKGVSQGNGLKGVSEGSGCGLMASQVNGSLLPHQLHFNHKLSQSPWRRASPSPWPAGSAAHWLTNGSNGSHESPRNNTAAQTTTTTTTTSPGSVKQEWPGADEEERADGWEEGCDSAPRANPILYYMLQRGKGQLGAAGDQGQETARCEMNIKEEAAADEEHQYKHRLSCLQ
ncbi:nuclear receptor-interacting protein 1 [Sardina pilchardus]|uniref:nuclear receptor-interacting protein 1 n=1 Tax=Sardina pilchardus TaxID=27697 RepID=UPI002E1271B9